MISKRQRKRIVRNRVKYGLKPNEILFDVDLSKFALRATDLSRADLRHANLSRADLRFANLSGANIKSADLSGANIKSADLSGANLSGANLENADLSGSRLHLANLSGATMAYLINGPVTLPKGYICETDPDYFAFDAPSLYRIVHE